MTRAKRHAILADLLAAGPLPSQEVMLQHLADRGVQTTQATLSRDLREIGVLKSAAGYVLPAILAGPGMDDQADAAGRGPVAAGLRGTHALERAMRNHLLAVRPGVGLVVCTTAPGHAQVIALELDRSPLPGVIGTVGGDDTVFVAVDAPQRVATLADELRELGGLAPAPAEAVGGAA